MTWLADLPFNQTAGYYVLASLALPYGAEICARTHANHPKQLVGGAYILLAAIGAMVGWLCLALLPFPLAATALQASGYAVFVIANNAKLGVLRMGLAAQDRENIRHMLLYPDFYFIHVGIGRCILAVTGFAALMAALIWVDRPLLYTDRPAMALMTWGAGLVLWFAAYRGMTGLAAMVFRDHRKARFGLTGMVDADSARYGLFGAYILHSLLIRDTAPVMAAISSAPYAAPYTAPTPQVGPTADTRPHIILIQGESFLDLSRVDSLALGRPAPWSALTSLAADTQANYGLLDAPAWGAYTMQTEMAVLTGIDRGAYGTASLNPYQAAAARLHVPSIAHIARAAGYRTVCLHPAKPGFFRRHAAMPNLGFDAFLSAKDFGGAARFGPYIADTALAEKAEHVMATHDQPLFLHLITMESHGPWDRGRLQDVAVEADLLADEPTGDHSYALYRAHMENLMVLMRRLLQTPPAVSSGDADHIDGTGSNSRVDTQRPRIIGLYGDHQPAHGPLFDRLGFDDPQVNWVMGRSDHCPPGCQGDLRAEDFGRLVMREAGFDL